MTESDWRPPFPDLARTLGLTEAHSMHRQLDLLIQDNELQANCAMTDEEHEKFQRRARVLREDQQRLEAEVPLALEQKLEGIVIEAAQLDAQIAHTEDMIERLRAYKHRLQQQRERSIQWRLERLLPMLPPGRDGKKRYRSPLGTIHYKPRPASFELRGEAIDLPPQFQTQPPPKLNAKAVREAFKKGEKLPHSIVVKQPPAVPTIRITKRADDGEEN